MRKRLSEMSLEELWQLFPIILTEHQDEWEVWYREEEEALAQILPVQYTARISHVGSTAVRGIQAKPIVDILVEITPGYNMKNIEGILCKNGWLCMSRDEKRMSFNKGYTENGFAERVFHLHLRYEGDNDELYFRDYLRAFPDTAAEYAALKRTLLRKYEFDRDGYTAAKSEFVRRVTALARGRFAGRYALWRW